MRRSKISGSMGEIREREQVIRARMCISLDHFKNLTY